MTPTLDEARERAAIERTLATLDALASWADRPYLVPVGAYDGLRFCARCESRQPVDNFPLRRKGQADRLSYCKPCCYRMQRASRQRRAA